MSENKWTERAIKRAIAIKQYRFLLRLEKLAREKELYATAAEYREEAMNIKERYAL
jgi:hypothetical protein